MLRSDIRMIALDFETTGLDTATDEPIQIGIVEFNNEGKIIGGFQSLIRPEKPLKELKSIVSFITGLSVEKLEHAPTRAEVEQEISTFFWDQTVIIGHNIGFDLEFLRKFFPSIARKAEIDTFRWAQTLIHYAPSYALEILCESLQSKANFQQILKNLQLFLWEEANFHDAFFDAKLSIALFRYLVKRVEDLIQKYPILQELLAKSKGTFAHLFQKREKSWIQPLVLPPLKKITAPHTQILSWEYPFTRTETLNRKKFQVKTLEFKKLLSSLATNKQTIFAFSNRSKLDIAKNLLNELGVKNLGFVKEEQTLNREALQAFVNKGQFEESEFAFLLKYFSHLEQGLGVLDLNSKGDYEIYTAVKDQRLTVNYPIILATHGGLFSLLEQPERYQNYDIVFFDCEWWYKSYNFYLSRPYDLNYTLNYLDMLSYKYHLEHEISPDQEEKTQNLTTVEEFRQFFTIFMGILGQETKAFFTHTEATTQTLDPLKWNLSFYQTNLLLAKFKEREPRLQATLQAGEFTSIRKQIEHMQTIFEGMMIVEKKMYSKSGFYFVYAEEVKFTNREEFLEEFVGHRICFLSHTDEQLPALIPEASRIPASSASAIPAIKDKNSDSTSSDSPLPTDSEPQIKPAIPAPSAPNPQKPANIHRLSKTPSVLQAILAFDREKSPNGTIFILSVVKEESKLLFETMIDRGLDQNFLLLVENITGGSGKNLFKAKHQGTKIIIWGYNFLLQLFAEKIAISELIVYNNKWNQQDLIFNDILRYGQENLL